MSIRSAGGLAPLTSNNILCSDMRIRALWTAFFLCCVMIHAAPGWTQGLPGLGDESSAIDEVDRVAHEAALADELEALGSPQATMQTFLDAMTQLWERPVAGWKQAVLTLDLPPEDAEQGRDRARQLYGILNRIGLIDAESLPDRSTVLDEKIESYKFFPDRSTQRTVLSRFKRPPVGSIVMRPDAEGRWKFDRATSDHLPALFEQMESLPLVAGDEILTLADYVRDSAPAWLTEGEFLVLAPWQWIAVFLLIVLGLLVDLIVRAILRRIERSVGVKSESEELRRQLRPIGLMAALLVWWIAVRFLDIQGFAGQVLLSALTILLAIAGTLAAWRLADLVGDVLSVRAKSSSSRIDDVLVPLLVRSMKILVIVAAIVFTASALDVPLTPLLASITVVSVAFSFAAKDTVENFFGSIAVLFDRPFDIGDWVVVDSTEGIVEEVGFRSTRVRTFYNSLVTIPNANLVRAVVDNYGRRRYRRWKTTLGVQYDTSPETLVEFTEGIRELVRLHPYTRKDYYEVYCNEFGASSLDILLYVFFDVPDWNTELRERERLFLDVVRLADQLGVQFAFPTTTVHVFEGETPTEPVGQPPGRTTEVLHVLHGAKTAQKLVEKQPWMRRKPPPVDITMGKTDIKLDDAGNPIVEDDEGDGPEPLGS